jgi:Permuted papain-like amidase enzyme, YaeF/YiiX, C92 family
MVLVPLLALLVATTPLPAVRDGDIVFQTSGSSQSAAIQRATRSPWSHMGIVFLRDGVPFVYEAVDPVQATPLARWVARAARRTGHLARSDVRLGGDGDRRLEAIVPNHREVA